MFGGSSVKQSSATSSSAAGFGAFQPVNNITINGGIDLTEPSQLLVLLGLAALGFYAYRKFK